MHTYMFSKIKISKEWYHNDRRMLGEELAIDTYCARLTGTGNKFLQEIRLLHNLLTTCLILKDIPKH